MTTHAPHETPERAAANGAVVTGEPSAAEAEELEAMYARMALENMVPLWTQPDDLMPLVPTPAAQPHVWRWDTLVRIARRAGDLVPVGRGGERRAIALANPGLGGQPFATPTLWAAIQYLGSHEVAPEHRHSQNAFRFVVEGEGVWTVVDGDPVRMSRGDLLLTPGWNFHGHHNASSSPMAWIDGLDIPFVRQLDAGFFELGSDRLTDESTPHSSRSERLWGHPGLRPASQLEQTVSSPIGAYRWEHTDRALDDQLALEDEGHPVTLRPGHAAVRFVNPTTGGDVMPTIRADFHRLRPQVRTPTRREVGSSIYQVFDGEGTVVLDSVRTAVGTGDLVVVPSWTSCSLEAGTQLDLFRFGDQPIFERLHLDRSFVEAGQ